MNFRDLWDDVVLRDILGYADGCKQNPDKGQHNCEQRVAAGAAQYLFLLCDRYVLYKDRDLHSMFMGRYYVLAVLFTNLGLSSIMVALASLVVLPEASSLGFISCAVGVPAVFGLALLSRSRYFRGRFVECTFPIFYAMIQAEKRARHQQS